MSLLLSCSCSKRENKCSCIPAYFIQSERELHKEAVLSAHEHAERTILLFTGNSAGKATSSSSRWQLMLPEIRFGKTKRQRQMPKKEWWRRETGRDCKRQNRTGLLLQRRWHWGLYFTPTRSPCLVGSTEYAAFYFSHHLKMKNHTLVFCSLRFNTVIPGTKSSGYFL